MWLQIAMPSSALAFGLLAELPQLVALGLKQYVDGLGCLALADQCPQRGDRRWRVEFTQQRRRK